MGEVIGTCGHKLEENPDMSFGIHFMIADHDYSGDSDTYGSKCVVYLCECKPCYEKWKKSRHILHNQKEVDAWMGKSKRDLAREELIQKLLKLAEGGNEAENHINADSLLLEYIDDIEIENAFHKIDKWYE